MAVKEIEDPRLQALFGGADPRDAGVRPTVRLPGKGVPPVVLFGVGLIVALLLFIVLDARRTRRPVPSAQQGALDNPGSAWAPPPPLNMPPVPPAVRVTAPIEQPGALPPVSVPEPVVTRAKTAMPVPAIPVAVPVQPQAAPILLPAPQPPQRLSTGSPLVMDAGAGSAGQTSGGASAGSRPMNNTAEDAVKPVERVRASAFANRSMTLPQGYLIPAVLETGFDSTKPGFARAIVSRDVRGFDGENVLIPRGSRLVGQYKSTTAQGQSRAVISWTRLIRPDGMTIEMDSPAVDTVGRGGVAASVNTHFLARLGDALLQSTFSIGQALAGRSANSSVIVVSGNASATASQLAAPRANYTPTLKVLPGKSISVFVAQDLDFSGAGAGR